MLFISRQDIMEEVTWKKSGDFEWIIVSSCNLYIAHKN